MARGQGNTPSINRFIQTTIHDADGEPVLVIGMREFTVIEADGTICEYKYGDNIVLEDGLVWNPSMMMQANPVLLATCTACRKQPPSLFRRRRTLHGLVGEHNARVCADCGAVSCPRHCRLIGQRWRCLPCSRRHRILRAIRPLFFSREEEP